MGLIFVIAIIFVVVWFKQNSPFWALAKTKNPDQIKVLKYLYGGFLVFGKITDQEYDALVAQKVEALNLKNKAIAKIGLDEDQIAEIPPVNFEGFDCSIKTEDLAAVYVGKDGKLRSTQYESTWLFFSDSQVYMYKYHFDMISDNKKENTEEYFYRDITNFSTQEETIEAFDINTGCTGKQTYKKNNKEYGRFGLIVPGDKFYCSTTNSKNIESQISAMKQKLREKKNA